MSGSHGGLGVSLDLPKLRSLYFRVRMRINMPLVRYLPIMVVSVLLSADAWATERLPDSVAQDDFIIYLFIGHSNMAGRAEPPDTEIDPHAWKYDYDLEAFVPAVSPAQPDANNKGNFRGAALPFTKAMVAAHPK